MCRLSINRPPAIIIRSSRRSCWIKVCNRTICISTRPRILINRNASSCYSLFRLLMESGSGSLSRFHAATARRLSPPLRENLPNRGEKSIALWRYGLSRDPFSAEAVNLGGQVSRSKVCSPSYREEFLPIRSLKPSLPIRGRLVIVFATNFYLP